MKAGFNDSGSQRYLCQACQRKYTPEPNPHGYDAATRREALRLYADGMNLRRIARTLSVTHPTVANWVNDLAAELPETPPLPPTSAAVHELDELFSFVGSKKSEVYVVTQVERETRCIVNWRVLEERSEPAFQAMLDESPQAAQYYSDAFGVYAQLIYDPGQHQALPNKSQTYAVEGCNAELRHYLARLARRSRCFLRCVQALRHAIKIFVFAWNRRQLFKRANPLYPAHVRDFVCP